jgi:hypothetical protein
MIYLNDKNLLKEPFIKRRNYLRASFQEDDQKFMFAKYRDLKNVSEID